MKNFKMELSAKLPVCLKKEDEVYIAHCPVLDVYSQGYSEEEAKNNLIEAIVLFFQSCIKRGTLDAVLKESGFEKARPYKKPITSEKDYINVPIHFAVPQTHPGVCHA